MFQFNNIFSLQIGVKVEQLRGINNDVEFTQILMSEQSVFVLPAKVSYV